MNVIRVVPLVSAVALLLASEAEAQAQKFAFVDSRIIVERAPGAIAAQAALQKESEDAQARVKLWQDSLQTMLAAYQSAEKSMTESVKANRQKAINERQADYAKRAEELDRQMEVRRQELSQPVMAQIRETLEDLRKEEGYTFIFDVAASGVIVAADKNLDLTEKVIGRLKPIPVAAKVDSARTSAPKPQPAGVKKP
jgi:outer membrane protein